nr:hypothetical protein [Janthinobacterium agaricidamnosum]
MMPSAVRRQAVGASLVKLGRVEHRAARLFIVQVDLQDIGAVMVGRVHDEVERVHFAHVEAGIVRRQRELRTADTDHVGIELDRGDPRLRQAVVAKLGQRGAAEPELDDVARLLVEQHPHHDPLTYLTHLGSIAALN